MERPIKTDHDFYIFKINYRNDLLRIKNRPVAVHVATEEQGHQTNFEEEKEKMLKQSTNGFWRSHIFNLEKEYSSQEEFEKASREAAVFGSIEHRKYSDFKDEKDYLDWFYGT